MQVYWKLKLSHSTGQGSTSAQHLFVYQFFFELIQKKTALQYARQLLQLINLVAYGLQKVQTVPLKTASWCSKVS